MAVSILSSECRPWRSLPALKSRLERRQQRGVDPLLVLGRHRLPQREQRVPVGERAARAPDPSSPPRRPGSSVLAISARSSAGSAGDHGVDLFGAADVDQRDRRLGAQLRRHASGRRAPRAAAPAPSRWSSRAGCCPRSACCSRTPRAQQRAAASRMTPRRRNGACASMLPCKDRSVKTSAHCLPVREASDNVASPHVFQRAPRAPRTPWRVRAGGGLAVIVALLGVAGPCGRRAAGRAVRRRAVVQRTDLGQPRRGLLEPGRARAGARLPADGGRVRRASSTVERQPRADQPGDRRAGRDHDLPVGAGARSDLAVARSARAASSRSARTSAAIASRSRSRRTCPTCSRSPSRCRRAATSRRATRC